MFYNAVGSVVITLTKLQSKAQYKLMFQYIGQFSLENISPSKFVTKARSFWLHNIA